MRRTGDLKLIQELNRFIIFDTIRKSGPLSRSEIAKMNHLSPTTVTSAVNQLIREGLVVEGGTGNSNGGRKPILVTFSPDSRFLLGISISNSETITIAEINLEAKIRRKKSYSLTKDPVENVASSIIRSIQQFIDEFSNLDKCIGISISVPGIVDAESGIVRYKSKLNMTNVPLKEIIESHFKLKTWVENDTNAMVLAEKYFGENSKENSDYKNLLYITIGNGIGVGIVINGSIFRGHRGGAGELGHTIIERGGVLCECGNRGCLENYINWYAIYSRIVASVSRGRYTLITEIIQGDIAQITPSIFKEALKKGDPLSMDILQESISYLSTGILNLVHLFDPDLVILGGEIAKDNDMFLSGVKSLVSEQLLDFYAEKFDIRLSSLGEDSELIGAAAVLLQDVFGFSIHT